MNKKGFSIYMMVLATMVMLSGCSKDKVDRMTSLPIVFEDFSGNDKAYIDNGYACWEDGDEVRISKSSDGGSSYSSYNGTISLSYLGGSASASASASDFSTRADDTVNVAYPRAMFSTSTINTSININMPSVYVYQESQGRQKIESPMIGRVGIEAFEEGSPNPNVLKLKNLCCLLRIKLDKPSSGAFVVDTIIVVNTTHTTAMSGSATISHSFGNDPTLSMTGSGVANDRIKLDLSSSAVALNGTKYFYIPIPPQAHGQEFKIYAHNQITGHWSYNTIQSQQSIPGNSVATIQGPSTEDVADYTFTDYIMNNNANSYINLGVAPDNTSKMEMTFEVTAPSGSQYYSGSSVAGKYLVFAISGANGDSYLTNHFFDDYVNSSAPNASNAIYRNSGNKFRVTVEVKESTQNAGYYYLRSTFEELDGSDNQLKVLTKDSPEHAGGLIAANFAEGIPNIYVFGFNSSRRNPGMKLYSYKVWKNGELRFNFVPAIETATSHHGVYNMVSGDFITGTGSFTCADNP